MQRGFSAVRAGSRCSSWPQAVLTEVEFLQLLQSVRQRAQPAEPARGQCSFLVRIEILAFDQRQSAQTGQLLDDADLGFREQTQVPAEVAIPLNVDRERLKAAQLQQAVQHQIARVAQSQAELGERVAGPQRPQHAAQLRRSGVSTGRASQRLVVLETQIDALE